MAYAEDLKSFALNGACGFDPHPGHNTFIQLNWGYCCDLFKLFLFCSCDQSEITFKISRSRASWRDFIHGE